MLSDVRIVCVVSGTVANNSPQKFSLGNTKHQEIFSFERVIEGRYKGKEWEEIVKPVIEKWGGFVEGYL
jgi:hypothetical protein